MSDPLDKAELAHLFRRVKVAFHLFLVVKRLLLVFERLLNVAMCLHEPISVCQMPPAKGQASSTGPDGQDLIRARWATISQGIHEQVHSTQP